MARFLWTQKEDIGPGPRIGHAMCFDSARNRTLLFGGDGLAPFGDSWLWSGESWTQVADTGPAPRRDHAMCFDTARNVALLFGGSSNGTLFGDTWSWNGTDWTQVEDTGPAARGGHGMAYDPLRSRVVLFGGDDGTTALRDTWEWDGEGWTQVEDAGPPPRRHHALAYDLVRRRTVLFGGESRDGTTYRDTWEWDGSAWTQIEDIGPPACMRSSMVSTDAQLVLFGGISSAQANPPPIVFDDSWVFRADQWTQRQDMGPAARWGHAMAFDAQRRTIVMFGGHRSADFGQAQDLLRDTWEHSETEAARNGPPPEGGPLLVQLTLMPDAGPPGEMITAEASLNAAAPELVQVGLLWVLQSVVDDAANNGVSIDPSQINQLGTIEVAPWAMMGSLSFAAPATPGETVVVAAILGENQAIALLQVS